MKKNLIVGQSGGPTAVINSSVYGVVTTALEEGKKQDTKIEHVYGMLNGIEGFLQEHYLEFGKDVTQEEIELLKSTPGAFLGSCRFMLPEDLNDETYTKLFELFDKLNIGYFLYCGGNDSMDTVSKISRFAEKVNSDIKVLGVPKTIDNDLVLTDHTPGFGSAAKYVATTVREIATDANVYEIPAVTIVEVMGRHAGWLTAASVLARNEKLTAPHLIYLPEVDFDIDDFTNKVSDLLKKQNAVVVCVSEGINDKNGKFICEYDTTAGVDSFGHKMLAGAGKFLENHLRSTLGCKARSVELNVSQRCSATLISKTDRDEAIASGKYAVEQAAHGKTGNMIAFDRADSNSYQITCSLKDVNEICNKEKKVPNNMISSDGTDITQDFIEYASPLIYGNIQVPSDKDGLPLFVTR